MRLRLILILLLALSADFARAQITVGVGGPSNTYFNVLPESGTWWNPAEPGSGFGIDVDRRGNVFINWYTYRDDGSSTFYTMIGTLARASSASVDCSIVPYPQRCAGDRARWASTGIIATMTSPVYAVKNGPCPVCPFATNVVTQSDLGPAEIRFFSSRVAEIQFRGRTIKLQMQDIATSFADLAREQWLVSMPYVRDFEKNAIAHFEPINVDPSAIRYEGPNSALPPFERMPVGVSLFRLVLDGGALGYPLRQIGNTTAEEVVLFGVDSKANRVYVLLTQKEAIPLLSLVSYRVISVGELFRYRNHMVIWMKGQLGSGEFSGGHGEVLLTEPIPSGLN